MGAANRISRQGCKSSHACFSDGAGGLPSHGLPAPKSPLPCCTHTSAPAPTFDCWSLFWRAFTPPRPTYPLTPPTGPPLHLPPLSPPHPHSPPRQVCLPRSLSYSFSKCHLLLLGTGEHRDLWHCCVRVLTVNLTQIKRVTLHPTGLWLCQRGISLIND